MRAYLRTELPGRTRLARYAASCLPLLQRVPIEIADGQIIYLDLRDAMCRDVLRNAPYQRHPWEPDEQDVIRRIVKEGDIALDIGAHFGEHAALVGSLVGPGGRVIAFEPNPERFDALRRTVTQHGNGELLPYAVSNAPGEAVLFVPEYHVTASLADWTDGRVGTVRQLHCRTVTIDALIDQGVIPQPTFVKCDVEGAELLVFEGARRTLDRTDAPIVMYEANFPGAKAFGTELAASTDFLRSLTAADYSIYWVQPQGTLVPVETLRSDVFLFNLVAVPAARHDAVLAA